MSRGDFVTASGTITACHRGGIFDIELDNGLSVKGFIGGRTRRNRIRMMLWDRVDCEMSPVDLSKARIVYRHKN
jgi:translation initiation factor IF-1